MVAALLAGVLLAPLTATAGAVANGKLASGISAYLDEVNVKQPLTLAAEKRWGTEYMHARYYSPNLGRFLSVDPVGGSVGSSQSWNRYSYVINNPLVFVDPSGETVYVVTYTTGNRRGDEELRRAAETRADEIRGQDGFDPDTDTVVLRGVSTKAEFSDVLAEANALDPTYGDVGELSLFSHAGPEDGPVFPGEASGSKQFTAAEVGALAINWAWDGSARFFGCNTADNFAGLWSSEQGFDAYGYDGYAYFSSNPNYRANPQPTGPLYLIYADGYRNSRLFGWLEARRGRAFARPMTRR